LGCAIALLGGCWISFAAIATPRYEIKRADDRVVEIRIQLKQGALVLDRFVDDAALIEREQKKFAVAPADDANCAALGGPGSCERTCYWAAKARPFTRMRLLGPTGGLKWSWRAVKRDAAPALLSAIAQSVNDEASVTAGECISPDEQFIALSGYLLQPGGDNAAASSLMGYRVARIAPARAEVTIVGKKTSEIFGHKQFTRFIGWKKNAPHTVVFDVTRPENNNQTIIDEGLARVKK
jgi:hypothetical protein